MWSVELAGFASVFEVCCAINLGFSLWRELRNRIKFKFEKDLTELIKEPLLQNELLQPQEVFEQNDFLKDTIKGLMQPYNLKVDNISRATKNSMLVSVTLVFTGIMLLLSIAICPKLEVNIIWPIIYVIFSMLWSPIRTYIIKRRAKRFHQESKTEIERSFDIVKILTKGSATKKSFAEKIEKANAPSHIK